jgi:hypothetical protein
LTFDQKDMEEARLVIAWYSKDEWEAWKLSVSDPEIFEDTFAEWNVLAEEKYKKLRSEGAVVFKVPIILQAFLAWCRDTSRPPDARARIQYAIEIQQALDKN